MPGLTFRSWKDDAVDLPLEFRATGKQRYRVEGAPDIGAPRVALPRTSLDCLTLDGLLDHPVLDPLTRQQLRDGNSFRLVRVPCSLLAAEGTRIEKARLGVHVMDRSGKTRVHSIYPQRIEIRAETNSELAFEPKLKIASVLELSGARIGKSVTVEHAQAVVTGIWSEAGADWLLEAPKGGAGLSGSWDFLLVLRWTGQAIPTPINVVAEATVASASRGLFRSSKQAKHRYSELDFGACGEVV